MSDDILKRFSAIDADPASAEPYGPLSKPTLGSRSPSPARRQFTWTVVAIGIAAIAVALMAVPWPSDDDQTPRATAPLFVASAAASEPRAPGTITYSRTKSQGLGLAGLPPYSIRAPILVQEAWVREDGSGRLRTKPLKAQWPGPRDRRRAIAAGANHDLRLTREPPPAATDRLLSADQLDSEFAPSLPPTRDLSDDPEELADQLAASATGEDLPRDAMLFGQAINLLFKPNIPGPVRAAGYELVAGLDGITVDESARDPLGRSTTSVSMDTGRAGEVSTLFFDPATAHVLAFNVTLAEPVDYIDSLTLTTSVVTDVREVDSIPPVSTSSR